MEVQEISKKLEALASPSRLKILCLLSLRAFCVCELANILNLAQPTLTRHLQKLEEAGFVKSTRYKFYTIYTLDYKDKLNKFLLDTLLPTLKNSSDFKKLETLPAIKDNPYNFP